MPSFESEETAFLQAAGKQSFSEPPRILIIGAGSRGTAYAEAVLSSSNAIVAAVCEPNDYKRTAFAHKFMCDASSEGKEEQSFKGWREWREYETQRREQERAGHAVEKGVNAVFVCVLD